MSSYYMINATPGHAIYTFPSNWAESKHDGEFIVRSHTTDLTLKKDDRFASFIEEPKADYNSEKIIMANTGIFQKVESTPTQPTNQEAAVNESRKRRGLTQFNYYLHNIKFTEGEPFTKFKFLDDYTYSLIKIYKRYLKPTRHFSRNITTLDKVDYETLQKERIFFERTLFGKLINALPYQNRLQFLLFSIDKFGKADLRDVKISDAFPLLKDFVGSGVISLGKTLINSNRLIQGMSDLFGDNADIGFADESELKKRKGKNITRIDFLTPQVELFEELFSISDSFEDLFSQKELKTGTKDKELFNKLFRKRFWPVDLNTDNQ